MLSLLHSTYFHVLHVCVKNNTIYFGGSYTWDYHNLKQNKIVTIINHISNVGFNKRTILKLCSIYHSNLLGMNPFAMEFKTIKPICSQNRQSPIYVTFGSRSGGYRAGVDETGHSVNPPVVGVVDYNNWKKIARYTRPQKTNYLQHYTTYFNIKS